MAKIMLADDELSMCNLIKRIVLENNHEFCCANDGSTAFTVFEEQQPDLLILDVMMPQMNGFQVCKKLREMGVIIPIIILTAKGEISDKETGFGCGADDYLVKPFSSQELILRIEAHLKRNERILPKQQKDVVVVGNFKFDSVRHRLTLGDRLIEFTPKEFRILLLLASHEGEVFTREQLVEAVWGEEYVDGSSSLPVFIRKIREKIEQDPSHPRHLQTAWRSGYRFES